MEAKVLRLERLQPPPWSVGRGGTKRMSDIKGVTNINLLLFFLLFSLSKYKQKFNKTDKKSPSEGFFGAPASWRTFCRTLAFLIQVRILEGS